MKSVEHNVDICVVGGGISGVCAAISAARHGASVVLLQDRPVLGGNASSEIRMWICGARGDNNRETGIIEELQLENFHRNSDLCYQIWDSVLYEKVYLEENITLILNCTCQEAVMDGNKIIQIRGWQLTTETYHTVKAKCFIDCSGDSILAPLTGAKFRIGRESRSEFNEPIAPVDADRKTMGLSCLFQIRETPGPKTFIPPNWAHVFKTDDDMPFREHHIGSNYWWIELGGDIDSIHDAENVRHELLKIAFGVWDHIKNRGDHGADNWIMDWIGFLPGKRESRRYEGDLILNQHDVASGGEFSDIVAYGGWTMDDHYPSGFNHKESYPTIHHPAPSPWGIPWRCLYSINIDNLFFAGRNISVTHTALSSSRVMGTCGLLGQAVGTASAIAAKNGVDARNICVEELQDILMNDDCFLPGKVRKVSRLSLQAQTNAEITRDGWDRDRDGSCHCWKGADGDHIYYSFKETQYVKKIRMIFDSDLNRDYHNMPSHYPLCQRSYKVPETIIKSYEIWGTTDEGEKLIVAVTNNYQRMIYHEVNENLKSIKIVPLSTWGKREFRIFSIDII